MRTCLLFSACLSPEPSLIKCSLIHPLPLLPYLQGSISPGERKELKFSCLPGLPGAFCRTYELKVADLDPENICLKGKAAFPIISINLPWNIKGGHCLTAPRKDASGFVPYHMPIGQLMPTSTKAEGLQDSQTNSSPLVAS